MLSTETTPSGATMERTSAATIERRPMRRGLTLNSPGVDNRLSSDLSARHAPKPSLPRSRSPVRLHLGYFLRSAMRRIVLSLASVFAIGLLTSPAFLQEKGGEEETGP